MNFTRTCCFLVVFSGVALHGFGMADLEQANSDPLSGARDEALERQSRVYSEGWSLPHQRFCL